MRRVVEHLPSPSPSATVGRGRVRRPADRPVRRRNPLATVLVMVVLTTVIASAAGLAFARAR
ncbi:hypothetical protein [Microtetraspora niveoalba]|uniref:hypothetical protein n=1 Tax=Microtetraspora niveoalba TaxID=46175 RepID=UPI0012F7F9C8|nr:hypothetical protein [Microtetraspora niveoalba]